MKLSDLVSLMEMPQYIDREMPRSEPEQLKMSVDAFEREFDLLHRYQLSPEAGAEPVTVVIGLAKDKSSALAGELYKEGERWIVHVRINLSFHDQPQASEIPGPRLQVDTVIASPSMKSRGMGFKLYESLINAGYAVFSDNTQFIGGYKLWLKIVRESVKSGYKVYIQVGYNLMRDEQGNAIAYNGSNIPHDKIWKKPGNASERQQDIIAYGTLLVATKQAIPAADKEPN